VHSTVGGTAWETTPWRAVQRAAWGPNGPRAAGRASPLSASVDVA
jgi:hypothetical protein